MIKSIVPRLIYVLIETTTIMRKLLFFEAVCLLLAFLSSCTQEEFQSISREKQNSTSGSYLSRSYDEVVSAALSAREHFYPSSKGSNENYGISSVIPYLSPSTKSASSDLTPINKPMAI